MATDRDRLDRALEVLHGIGSAYFARKALERPNLTAPLRESMRRKALTDEQIERLALDTWEAIAMELAEEQARKGGT